MTGNLAACPISCHSDSHIQSSSRKVPPSPQLTREERFHWTSFQPTFILVVYEFISTCYVYKDRVSFQASAHQKNLDVGANLFIGNLDPEVDEKMLYDIFSAFGVILQTPKVSEDSILVNGSSSNESGHLLAP